MSSWQSSGYSQNKQTFLFLSSSQLYLIAVCSHVAVIRQLKAKQNGLGSILHTHTSLLGIQDGMRFFFFFHLLQPNGQVLFESHFVVKYVFIRKQYNGNMEAISKELCPLWYFAYNSNFLVVTFIIIDLFFPILTLEHQHNVLCILWVL